MEHIIVLSDREKMVLEQLLASMTVYSVRDILQNITSLDYNNYRETFTLVCRIYQDLSQKPK